MVRKLLFSLVYLVSHSAGGTVALAALETAPPGAVDRAVLLSPSVSADYDLRPALRAVRGGLDVFHSRRDLLYLGLGTGLVGNADGQPGAASGRVGFQPRIDSPADAALYARLRQHPWDPALVWTGNRGGHEGSHQPRFLRAYVLPLFREDPGSG
jgi:pimeloyl-ACP methyl ester carboxylesterase